MNAPEFDGRPMTKREVLIAREAFVRGIDYADTLPPPHVDIHARDRFYPLPKVTRPRVVILPERAWELPRQWRYVDGTFQSRSGDEYPWSSVAQITPNHTCIAALADLLKRPTEEVEDV